MNNMNNKKIFALILAAALGVTPLAACGEKEPTGEVTKAFSSMADIGKAVKEGLGDNYFGDLTIDSEILDAMFGVKAEWVDDFFGEMAQISDAHNDRFVLVKATEGHATDVENAFKDYMEFDFNSERQYPQHVQKTKAAQVYRNNDYVALIITGPVDTNADDSTNYKNALDSNLKAISIIEEYIGGK